MFTIPAAQKDFQEKAAAIKAEQIADADAAEKQMQAAIEKWNAMTPEERQAKEQEMRDDTVTLNTH